MLKLKRKLVIENFVENTTIHGIFYINQKNKTGNLNNNWRGGAKKKICQKV